MPCLISCQCGHKVPGQLHRAWDPSTQLLEPHCPPLHTDLAGVCLFVCLPLNHCLWSLPALYRHPLNVPVYAWQLWGLFYICTLTGVLACELRLLLQDVWEKSKEGAE